LYSIQIDEFRQIAQDAQDTLNLRNMDSTEGKSMVKPIFNNAIKGLRRLGCSRHDDVVSRAFDMPEAPSNRPSMVRVSQPSATPAVPIPSTSHTSNPRRDSSLLDRSKSAHISQRHSTTQVINLRTYIPPELTTMTHFFPNCIRRTIIFRHIHLDNDTRTQKASTRKDSTLRYAHI
jgi:hypothetical protein